MEKLKLSVPEIVGATGESASVVRDAIAAGHLKTFLVGRRRFARPAAVASWIDLLEARSDAGSPIAYRKRPEQSGNEE